MSSYILGGAALRVRAVSHGREPAYIMQLFSDDIGNYILGYARHQLVARAFCGCASMMKIKL